MKFIGVGIMCAGMGIIWFLLVVKEYLRRGYITDGEALLSKIAIIITIVGIIIAALGWSGLK